MADPDYNAIIFALHCSLARGTDNSLSGIDQQLRGRCSDQHTGALAAQARHHRDRLVEKLTNGAKPSRNQGNPDIAKAKRKAAKKR